MQKIVLYICASMLVGAIFHMMAPNGTMKNSIKFTINVFLICIVAVPLIGHLSKIDLSKYSNTTIDKNLKSKNLEYEKEKIEKKHLENALNIVFEKNGYKDLDISIDIDREKKTTSIIIKIPKNKNYNKDELEKIVKNQTGLNATILDAS